MPDPIDPNDDPNIFGVPDETDDATDAAIHDIWKRMMADEGEDDGGFDQPPVDRASNLPDVVGPDEAHDLLDQAKERKAHGSADDQSEDGAADDDAGADGEAAQKDSADAKGQDVSAEAGAEAKPAGDAAPEDDNPLKAAPVSDLLADLDDGKRAEITRRISAADEVMGLFKGRDTELQALGVTPAAAVARMMELNEYAKSKPDEYIAWVSSQISGDEPAKALEGAAKLLGMKVVPADDSDDDDDEFMSPRERELLEENRRLKAKNTEPEFGPDTPERRRAREVQQELQSFLTETDDTGQPKRPHWSALEAIITQRASRKAAETGQPVTVSDLDALYAEEVQKMRTAFSASDPAPQGGANTAAQRQSDMEKTIQQKAAAAQKAKKASMNVDGTGQGASRRPALSPDADLDTVIRTAAGLA